MCPLGHTGQIFSLATTFSRGLLHMCAKFGANRSSHLARCIPHFQDKLTHTLQTLPHRLTPWVTQGKFARDSCSTTLCIFVNLHVCAIIWSRSDSADHGDSCIRLEGYIWTHTTHTHTHMTHTRVTRDCLFSVYITFTHDICTRVHTFSAHIGPTVW